MAQAKQQDPIEYAQCMVDAVLDNRVHDNAGEKDYINHAPEELQARLFNAYCDQFYSGDYSMTPHKVQVFHIFYAVSRVLINMREGKMLWDKIVDFGGWTQVAVDYVEKNGID